MAVQKEEIQVVAQNKKAYHDYFVEETYEAGIELFGTEVKSIRKGRVNLKDSWCSIDGGEILVNGEKVGVKSKEIISYLPERTHLDKSKKVTEIMDFFGKFYKDFDREKTFIQY